MPLTLEQRVARLEKLVVMLADYATDDANKKALELDALRKKMLEIIGDEDGDNKCPVCGNSFWVIKYYGRTRRICRKCNYRDYCQSGT